MPRGNTANLGHYAHPKGGYQKPTVPRASAVAAKKVVAPTVQGGTGIAKPMQGVVRPVGPMPLTPRTPGNIPPPLGKPVAPSTGKRKGVVP